uniref:Uncharacterized protein n=1 Tax=Anguilla anguilla TaxID=7936 RepID=A0A0E9UPZ9_ANGAN
MLPKARLPAALKRARRTR